MAHIRKGHMEEQELGNWKWNCGFLVMFFAFRGTWKSRNRSGMETGNGKQKNGKRNGTTASLLP